MVRWTYNSHVKKRVAIGQPLICGNTEILLASRVHDNFSASGLLQSHPHVPMCAFPTGLFCRVSLMCPGGRGACRPWERVSIWGSQKEHDPTGLGFPPAAR